MKKATSICAAAALLLLSACSTQSDEPSSISGSVPQNSSVISESTADNSADSSTVTSSTSSDPPESSAEESSHSKPVVVPGNNDGEMSGSVLVLKNGRGLVLYGGGYKNGQNYAEALNKYKEILGANVNVFSMVVPTAVSFYLPEKYSDWSASEWDNIENINDYLDDSIITVDAYTEIAKHTDEGIYLRTDNHWTSLGAYYAAREFAKTALVDSFPELNEDNFEYISRDGYVGTLYGYSNEAPELKNNPERFTYYKPKTTYTTDYYSHGMEFQYTGALMLDIDNIATVSWYLVNMCGDMYTAHVKTECKNARKLLIVKDSYGDALPAFLTTSFEDIWVVDMRYFEKSVTELAKSEGITDVLFAMNPLSATGDGAKNLTKIM